MDSSVIDIRFDKNGVCNYCTEYLAKKPNVLPQKNQLDIVLKKLSVKKNKGRCIVGVSGGLDSSYLLYKCVALGLNPIAVHIDTGWNTETSAHNLESLTQQLGVPLKTYVLNWNEFRKLQVAYLKAGVIDVEFPTDHYYVAGLYKMADELNIRYILTGNNFISEGIMPECWIHNKGDTANMLDIYKKHDDGTRLNRLPTMTLFKRFYYYNLRRIETVFFLNYFDYNREEAKKILLTETGWKEPPAKHGESVFTRFYHRYIMPVKFNADIRKAHLSSLICNDQISRQSALEILAQKNPYEALMKNDKPYVLKKLGLNESEFDAWMKQPIVPHSNFKTETGIKRIYNTLSRIYGFRTFLKISNRT
ncbi:MAG: N-acetyl sugar amidotransferase [Bacteroidia bacterium]|nr:N-acetyl sugar amidotransferase [Bacteroidia bacterium]